MTTENMVKKLMADYNVAGMSVAIIRDGEIVSTEGYGLRDADAQLPMTADTVMPIGSITKTFTSLALGMLVDEGKLDWDAPVITYIPTLKLSSALLTENVTVRDLLCHRTGVPKYDLQAIPGNLARLFFFAENLHQCVQHITPPLRKGSSLRPACGRCRWPS